MTTTHTAMWAKAQASRDRDAFFDLAIAIIDDHFDDEISAPKVVSECAKNEYDLSLIFASRVIRVAKAWGRDKLVDRRVQFNSFRPVHTLVAMIGTEPGEKPTGAGPTPVLADGTIDTETVYDMLASTGKPITHREVLKLVGKANFDTDEGKAVDSADVVTVAATMPADALQDRIANDKAFRDALVDLIVLGGSAKTVEAAEPGVADALIPTLATLDALAELKRAEAAVRRVAEAVSENPALADQARSGRIGLRTATDLLDLALDGVSSS